MSKIDDDIEANNTDKKTDSSSGMTSGSSATITPKGWLLFITGMLLLGSYQTSAKLAQGDKGYHPIPVPIAILVMEGLKFVISVYRLISDIGLKEAGNQFSSLSWQQIYPYGIPGALYMLNNNLEIYVLAYMDPATYRLLNNGKIFTTAVLFRFIMQKKLTSQQIFSLFLLLLGTSLASQTNNNEEEGGEMYATNFGLILMVFYCTFSGLAGVINEWIMKKGAGNEKSIHLQNAILYAWGFLFNLSGSFGAPETTTNFDSSSQAFWWIAFVLNGALHGLVISFMMKYLSSIWKLFMSASAIFIAAALQMILLGATTLPMSFVVAAVLVSISLFLYNRPGVLC